MCIYHYGNGITYSRPCLLDCLSWAGVLSKPYLGEGAYQGLGNQRAPKALALCACMLPSAEVPGHHFRAPSVGRRIPEIFAQGYTLEQTAQFGLPNFHAYGA